MIFCTECGKEITRMTKIYMDEGEKFICPTCFANPSKPTKKPSSRNKSSQYQIINNLDENIMSSDWTAHEELLLLEALQSRGFGNWIDICEKVATKNKEECELHYM
jgi:transcriptional adapter 2-alpha